MNDCHAIIIIRDFAEEREGVILASVIHKDKFKVVAGRLHNVFDVAIELNDTLLLVIKRNDDAILHADSFMASLKNNIAAAGEPFTVGGEAPWSYGLSDQGPCL